MGADDDEEYMSKFESAVAGETASDNGSQASGLDSVMAKMAQKPVNLLLWSTAVPYLIAFLIEALAGLMDYTIVMAFAGVHGLMVEAVYLPFELMVVRHALGAIATTAAHFCSRSLSESRVSQAVTIFTFYTVIGIVWSCVCPIIFASWVAPLTKLLDGYAMDYSANFGPTDLIYIYIALVAGPVGTLLGDAVGSFLAAENLVLLNVLRIILYNLVYVFFDFVCFYVFDSQVNVPAHQYDPAGPSRNLGAVQSIISAALSKYLALLLVGFWISALVFSPKRLACLDLVVRGNLRANFRKFAPKNLAKHGAYFGRIFLHAVPHWMNSAFIPFACFLANIYYGLQYTSTSTSDFTSARLAVLTYLRYYALFSCIHYAFIMGFKPIINFNLASRQYWRTKVLMTSSVLWMEVFTFVICIIGIILRAPFFRFLLLNLSMHASPADAALLEAVTPHAQQAVLLAAVSPIFLGPYYIILAIFEAEGKFLLVFLFSAARMVCFVVLGTFTAFTLNDGVQLLPAVCISDCCVGGLGIIYFIYFMYKYNHLANVEEGRKAKKSLDEQLAEVEAEERRANELEEARRRQERLNAERPAGRPGDGAPQLELQELSNASRSSVGGEAEAEGAGAGRAAPERDLQTVDKGAPAIRRR